MPTLNLSTDPTHDTPAVRRLREMVMADLATEEDFAAAVGKGLRSIKNWRRETPPLPHRFIGRTPYVVVKPALEWIERRFAPEKQPRKGGRPRTRSI